MHVTHATELLMLTNVAHDGSYENVKQRFFMKRFEVREAASIEVFSLH